MTPDPRFANRPKQFWAYVRSLSQEIGYVQRLPRNKAKPGAVGPIKVPSPEEMRAALESIGLQSSQIVNSAGQPTDLGRDLIDYFDYRARVLNTFAERNLMNAEEAQELFEKLQKRLKSQRPVPLNKQSQEKKKPAYLTAIVNMLIEASIEGLACDYDPRKLTTITQGGAPFRTLARRIDGAFPSPVNPIAVWEIKEYYYTTTFGSRVADGVYETLLDGMEIEEIRRETAGQTHIRHYLMVDAHYTWWTKGRSYLCRIIDMLHMGYVDEVLFGREVERRLPVIVAEWVQIYKARQAK
ncbi:MAG: hypothetical protein SFU86_17880 [Pirellulaceae bacterium]|nr:hypothetical protein [Pirellulaceae bacterium]